jgi:signal transduction histidine kinase
VTSVANRDEVGSMVAHVNRTSAQLADLYAKEREARAALETQIAEVRRTQAQLIQSEKLRALGEMSAGVAHDFNNLLASVLGQAELLRDQLERGVLTPSETDRRLRIVQQAALDGAETVRRLFEFTRAAPDDAARGAVHLREINQAVLAVAEPRWKDEAHAHGRDITVATRIEDVPPMLGNPAELREVLLNLVFNAIDAMPEGGRLTITAARAGDLVGIAVSDTGVGMVPEVAARVFEPFFTTKGLHRSGLGLSMSYGIVQRHGGEVTVASTPGGGSTFTVTLPFRVPGAAPSVPVPAATNGGGLRILVVDDEDVVREALRTMCQSAGHEVTEAQNGNEAVEALRRQPVDLVITDLGMPGMTGWQLADYIAATYASIRVVLVTGWSARVAPDLLEAHGISALIAKPFRRQDVLAIVAGFAPRAG